MFKSQTLRENDQSVAYTGELPEWYGWTEGFRASMGNMIDEELMISSGLNREDWRDRLQKVRDLEINLQDYGDQTSRGLRNVRWDEIQKKFPEIKTDEELNEIRNEKLKVKREARQEVMANAPVSSTLAGGMAGAMADPITLATLPIGVGSVRGLMTLGKATQSATKIAATEAGLEALIQPFVYKHKNEIGSEHTIQDSIENIGLAAGGAFTLGLAGNGILGYLKAVKSKSGGIDDVALEQIDRAIDVLERERGDLPDLPEDELNEFLIKGDMEVLTRYDSQNFTVEEILPEEIEIKPRQTVEAGEDMSVISEGLEGEELQMYRQVESEYKGLGAANDEVEQMDLDAEGLSAVRACFRG